jgi:outer membrane protein assembly factor BamB
VTLRPMIATAILCCTCASAEDWPEWRGKGRTGVWRDTGVLEAFPESGLKIKWRVPIHGGYAGPAVAGGRVFVTDFSPAAQANKGTERVLALDEKTGKVLWTRSWNVDYTGLMQTSAIGPRATPTVDGDRVYTLGSKGMLHCLDVRTGEVIWKKDYVREYDTQVPTWGMTGAPLVDGNLLIALVGGARAAKVVAFDKLTGKEVWRALDSDTEPGYGQPFLVEYGETRQIIIWHPFGVASLDPKSGSVNWNHPFREILGQTLATPVLSRSLLFISSFHNGSMMMELDKTKPASQVLWKASKEASEVRTEALHSGLATPVVDGDYIYGICSFGELRCLRARTGERVWETPQVTGERGRWATAFIVRNGDRYFFNNDQGYLIIGRLSPQGYREISRTRLIEPTTNMGSRRGPVVNWSHPAYANRHIFARNDREILCASLENE